MDISSKKPFVHIAEKKKVGSKLRDSRYYDQMTSIPLPTNFIERLNSYLTDAKNKRSKLALLFIDVDNFKFINNIYGYYIGDLLLKKIALKLNSCIYDKDKLCRIGGDEFVLILSDFTNINFINETAKKIINLFHKPITIQGHEIYFTITIGISIYPINGQNGAMLLRKANIAMYTAKKMHKNSLQYFHSYMDRKISLQNDIKKDLKAALAMEQFFLCYQPLIDVQTKKMIWMEALIRWRHPEKGIINPIEFISIAEKTGLIVPVGEWVLENACKQLKAWHKAGYSQYGLSVNVSAIQLQQIGFANAVIKILKENDLQPEYLELEITESVFIKSIHTVFKNLSELRNLGVKVSIDDFGTGYNSLKYLQKLIINSIKIDRVFISNIKADINKVIIDSVISLGHKINAEITAEGVETKEQYEYLKRKGCDKIQGYYFSKPLLPKEVIKLMEVNNLAQIIE